MTIRAMGEQGRIGRLLLHHLWQNGLRWLHGGPLFRWQPFAGTPSRLLIAPRTCAPPTRPMPSIYTAAASSSPVRWSRPEAVPLRTEGEDPAWQRELHSFGWLRDLRAAESLVARQNARALVDDWIRLCGRWDPIAWEQPVVARRVLSWLAQSPLVLEDGDAEFYRRFLRSLGRQVRYLRRTINETPDGVPRLQAALAVAAASISMAGQGRYVRQSLRRLEHELQRQIMPDGGHVSRNPGAILDILTDLLPIRQAFVTQGLETPAGMMQAIDRMMPMVRFFRHVDGAFAHFNGMGSTPTDLVATILAYDDARGAPPGNAPFSGYQRLMGGDTVVLMDTGTPPPPLLSESAHAGCLSLEMSSGRHRLVVNCGVSGWASDGWRQVARSTAAHSTAGMEDSSSCRFLTEKPFTGWLGSPILTGPTSVPVNREEDAMGTRVTASHDGYAHRYNVLHERDIRLSSDGSVLDGIDLFSTLGALTHHDHFTIRFHLHPLIKPSLLRAGTCSAADGARWRSLEFNASGAELVLEESVYLSDVYGHRRTQQLVLYGRISQSSQAAWQFRRTAGARNVRRERSTAEEPELPL
ncbi:heparinase II/III family protein [Pannonibacter sp. Pt2-lr]